VRTTTITFRSTMPALLTSSRNAKKVKALSMYKEGKVQRNADGQITKAASYQSRDIPNARIEPNRKWFTNTRVVSQDTLKAFREAMAEKANDPYQVLLKSNKLPMSLIRDGQDTNGIKQHRAKMTVESSPFADTFGPRAQRKRVKLGVSSLEDLADDTEKSMDSYQDRLEQAKLLSGQGDNEEQVSMAIEPVFDKGQSKRIWNELYKVIDSSDVVIHVLDARDPVGTRCRSVEKYLKEEAPHKHLIFVLNKCDLVPTSVAVCPDPFLPSHMGHLAPLFDSPRTHVWLKVFELRPGRFPMLFVRTPSFIFFMKVVCYGIGRLNLPFSTALAPVLVADGCRFGHYREMARVSNELRSTTVYTRRSHW